GGAERGRAGGAEGSRGAPGPVTGAPDSGAQPPFTIRSSRRLAYSLSHSARFLRAVTSAFVVVGLWRSSATVTSRSSFLPLKERLSPSPSVLVSVIVMPSASSAERVRAATSSTEPSTTELTPRLVR